MSSILLNTKENPIKQQEKFVLGIKLKICSNGPERLKILWCIGRRTNS